MRTIKQLATSFGFTATRSHVVCARQAGYTSLLTRVYLLMADPDSCESGFPINIVNALS